MILLYFLGVEKQLFLDMQAESLEFFKFENMINTVKKVVKLADRNEEDLEALTDMTIILQKMAGLELNIFRSIRSGANIMKEPVLSCSLFSSELIHLILVHEKQRILIKKSAVLFGVVDPTGILKPDEIFVQIQRKGFNFDFINNKNKFQMPK